MHNSEPQNIKNLTHVCRSTKILGQILQRSRKSLNTALRTGV